MWILDSEGDFLDGTSMVAVSLFGGISLTFDRETCLAAAREEVSLRSDQARRRYAATR